MNSPILIIIVTQLLFTSSDLLGRTYMKTSPFALSTFLSWWFLAYFTLRQIAMFGQLYVFTQLEVGKTMAFFGAASIIIVNILGLLFLGEQLSVASYAGVFLSISAFFVLALSF